MKEGEEITLDKIQFQRPSPEDAFDINKIEEVLGKKANKDIHKGDYIRINSILW